MDVKTLKKQEIKIKRKFITCGAPMASSKRLCINPKPSSKSFTVKQRWNGVILTEQDQVWSLIQYWVFDHFFFIKRISLATIKIVRPYLMIGKSDAPEFSNLDKSNSCTFLTIHSVDFCLRSRLVHYPSLLASPGPRSFQPQICRWPRWYAGRGRGLPSHYFVLVER